MTEVKTTENICAKLICGSSEIINNCKTWTQSTRIYCRIKKNNYTKCNKI